MTRPAPTCSLPQCRVKTTDPSGRCHHHRSAPPTRLTSIAPPVPVASIAPTHVERLGDDGGVTRESWKVDGEFHRADGPAVIEYSKKGGIYQESYYRHGKLHRADGPARSTYRENGQVGIEDYYLDGEHTRDGGPAEIMYHENGTPTVVTYLRDGKRHRIDGPAVVAYSPSGEVEEENFFFGNYCKANAKELHAHLARHAWTSPAFMRAEYERSPYAPLLHEFGVEKLTEVLGTTLPAGVRTVEGIREVIAGAPVEWVRAYEEGQR